MKLSLKISPGVAVAIALVLPSLVLIPLAFIEAAFGYSGGCIARSDLDNVCSYWEYLGSNGFIIVSLALVGGVAVGVFGAAFLATGVTVFQIVQLCRANLPANGE